MFQPHQSTFSTGRERRKSSSLLLGSIQRVLLPVLIDPLSEQRGCPSHDGKDRERCSITREKRAGVE